MSGTRSRTDGRRDTWEFTFQGERPDLTKLERELSDKKRELDDRRSKLSARKSRYKTERARYDSLLAGFEKKNQQLKTVGQRLKEYSHERPSLNLRDDSRPIVPRK
jgi:chromosome segregation ATPase